MFQDGSASRNMIETRQAFVLRAFSAPPRVYVGYMNTSYTSSPICGSAVSSPKSVSAGHYLP